MIWEAFCAKVAAHPNQPAVIHDAVQLSYVELMQEAERMSRQLPEGSCHTINRVLLAKTSPLAMLVSLLACWCAGLVPVIVREGRNAEDLEQLRQFTSAVALVTEGGIDMTSDHGCAAPQPVRSPRGFGPRDEAMIMCTSGTTSTPKLVALPAESVLVNAEAIGQALGLTGNDLIAVATPLTYMYGLMGGAMAGLWAGATVRLFRPETPHSLLQAAIRRDRISVVQGPPSFMRLFMSYWNGLPFDRVRIFTTGGEYMAPSLFENLAAAFPASRGYFLYGMTEAGPRISHTAFDCGGGVDGCIGIPFPHIGWRIEPVSEGDLPQGTGRLVLHGRSLFLGYLSADGGYWGLEADGSFVSNDLVQQLPDGTLRYLERSDRVFKSGGRLVNPGEVEAVLAGHPSVSEAVCYAQSHDILGLIPVTEVVLASGAQTDAKALIAHCQDQLQKHAVPRKILFSTAFAVNPSGKRSGRTNP